MRVEKTLILQNINLGLRDNLRTSVIHARLVLHEGVFSCLQDARLVRVRTRRREVNDQDIVLVGRGVGDKHVIVVELKAVSALNDEHRAQVQNYIRAGGFRLGLLVNFGHYPKVEWERIVL